MHISSLTTAYLITNFGGSTLQPDTITALMSPRKYTLQFSLPPIEPLPSSIDSWARGIAQQSSSTSLQSKISSAEPVQIQHPTHIIAFSESQGNGQEVNEMTDFSVSHQERHMQHRTSVQSETNTSSIGIIYMYMYT